MSEPTGSAVSAPNDQSGSASSGPTSSPPAPSAPASTSPATPPTAPAVPSSTTAGTPAGYTYTGDDERYYPDPPYVIDVRPGYVLTGVDEPPNDGRWRPATAAEISAAEGAK